MNEGPVFEIGAPWAEVGPAMGAAFRRHGAGVYHRAVAPELLLRCRAALDVQYPQFAVGSDGGHDADGEDRYKVGSRRFFASAVVEDCFAEREILANPALEPLIKDLLGDDYVIEAFGVIVALPGAKAQHVHRDGHELFPGTGLDRVVPPHALTYAVPLVDVSVAGTRIWTGSHRLGSIADLAGDADFITSGTLGTAAMWDFRTYHGGLAHDGPGPRPLLYITYSREWWYDSHNFDHEHGERLMVRRAALEAMDEDLRARFARATVV